MIVAVPLKSASGTKRTRVPAAEASSTAELFVTAPKAVQAPPPLVEYCQAPLASSTPMTAMPSTAPASTSVIRSPPALAIMVETRAPALLVSSSSMAASVMAPALSSTGASLTSLT